MGIIRTRCGRAGCSGTVVYDIDSDDAGQRDWYPYDEESRVIDDPAVDEPVRGRCSTCGQRWELHAGVAHPVGPPAEPEPNGTP